jgi:nucleoside-diphosphate-sugar epimerase
LAAEILSLLDMQKEIRVTPMRLRPGKSEVQRLISDNGRARSRLEWTPRVSLRQGLSETIEWISANLRLYHPERYQL